MPNRIDPAETNGPDHPDDPSSRTGPNHVRSAQDTDEQSLLHHLRRIYDPKALELLRRLRAKRAQAASPEKTTNRAHPPGVSPG